MASSKIEIIVNDIIEQNKIEFNKKSKLEQDKEKDDIIETIEIGLVGRDNDERNIILSEISKNIRNSAMSFFDSQGNISIEDIKEFTNITIQSAEERGILVNREKNKKANSEAKEAILTTVLINKMINEYEKISYKEEKVLIQNYENLSTEQRKLFNKKFFEKAFKNENLSEEAKVIIKQKKLENDIRAYYSDLIKELGSDVSFETIYNEMKKVFPSLEMEMLKTVHEQSEKQRHEDDKKNFKDVQIICVIDKINYSIREGDVEELKKTLEEYQGLHIIDDYLKKNQIINISQITINKLKSLDIILHEYLNNSEIDKKETDFQKVNEKNNDTTNNELDEKIKSEIHKIPNELIKSGFSKEYIKEAIGIYTDLLNELTQNDINNTNDDILDILYSRIDEIQLSENTEEILGIILPLTYDNAENNDDYSLKNILNNKEIKEAFLQEFDDAINQSVNLEQEYDLENDVAQYFESNAVEIDISAIKQENVKDEIIYKDVEEKASLEQNIEETKKNGQVQKQNLALELQDNSFFGKIKRFAGLMRSKKENDKSQGFFSRLKSSFKEVFGNKNNNEFDVIDESTIVNNQITDSQTFAVQHNNDFIPKAIVDERVAINQSSQNRFRKQTNEIEKVSEEQTQ